MSVFIRCRDSETKEYGQFHPVSGVEIVEWFESLTNDKKVSTIQFAEADNENFRILRTAKRERNWQ